MFPDMMRSRLLILLLVVAACGGATSQPGGPLVADLRETSEDSFRTHLEALDKPAVVNVWASWCLPCRSEAPLLNDAFESYGNEVEFIGVDVQDQQADAKEFLSEFGLDFDHFFDPDREIPNGYGGLGTPITFFFLPNGELFKTHNGVVDERTLALNIDELLSAG